MAKRAREVGIQDVRVGDAVRVHWLDASEVTKTWSKEERGFDTPIRSYGVFLGVKGLRTKHAVIAKEVVEHKNTFHYNVIPVGMIEKIVLLNRADLEESLLKCLQKKVEVTPLKKFRRGRGGGKL